MLGGMAPAGPTLLWNPWAFIPDPARYENFHNLESEIAALGKRSERRQMSVECRAKRNSVKARNPDDRIQHENDLRGDA